MSFAVSKYSSIQLSDGHRDKIGQQGYISVLWNPTLNVCSETTWQLILA